MNELLYSILEVWADFDDVSLWIKLFGDHSIVVIDILSRQAFGTIIPILFEIKEGIIFIEGLPASLADDIHSSVPSESASIADLLLAGNTDKDAWIAAVKFKGNGSEDEVALTTSSRTRRDVCLWFALVVQILHIVFNILSL